MARIRPHQHNAFSNNRKRRLPSSIPDGVRGEGWRCNSHLDWRMRPLRSYHCSAHCITISCYGLSPEKLAISQDPRNSGNYACPNDHNGYSPTFDVVLWCEFREAINLFSTSRIQRGARVSWATCTRTCPSPPAKSTLYYRHRSSSKNSSWPGHWSRQLTNSAWKISR